MAVRLLFPRSFASRLLNCKRLDFRCIAEASNAADEPPDVDEIEQILQQRIQDMPATEMTNPYQKEKPECILCKYQVDINYKNTKLLSQFVSPFTGRIYSRSITGLCKQQYKRIGDNLMKARVAGLMPYIHKDVEFLKDPQLFNPSQTFRRRRQT